MSDKIPITTWYTVDEDGITSYNHFENGHSMGIMPTPKTKEQLKAWRKLSWEGRYAYLIKGKVRERTNDR